MIAVHASDLLEVVKWSRFLWTTEDDLQAGLARALGIAGYDAQREVRLNARDRIDLLVDRVGIEVKTAGALRDVARQLERYLRSPLITDLILVTCKAQHLRIPERVVATDPIKRLHVHQLAVSGL